MTLVVLLCSWIKLVKMSCTWFFMHVFLGYQEIKTKIPYRCTFAKHTPRISCSSKFHPCGISTTYCTHSCRFPTDSVGFSPFPSPCLSLVPMIYFYGSTTVMRYWSHYVFMSSLHVHVCPWFVSTISAVCIDEFSLVFIAFFLTPKTD